MRLVTAVVQPAMMTQVQIALAQHGIAGMTVTECSGYARQRGHKEIYRGAEFTIDFIAKAKIEVLVADEEAEAVIAVIMDAASTRSSGSGPARRARQRSDPTLGRRGVEWETTRRPVPRPLTASGGDLSQARPAAASLD